MENKRIKTRTLTGVALLTAIVVILQFLGTFIRFGPFSVSLVLIPIVVGAALYGAAAGAWLGFALVLVKGTAAGFCAGLTYRALSKKNELFAAVAAAIVCPVVNTGLFLVGCLLFFMPTITEWSTAAGFPNVGNYMIFGLVGVNFLFELLVDVVLSPVIVRLIKAGRASNSENRWVG